MKTAAAFLATVLATFGGATSTPATLAPCVNIAHTLSLGSKSAEVAKLQQFLGVSQTGYFGPQTRQKLLAWQLSHAVVPSAKTLGAGTTGPKTRAALKCAPAAASATATSSQKQIVAPVAPTPIATSSTIVPVAPAQTIQSIGGSSGAPNCPAFTVPKPTGQCEWEWQKVIDESGCYIDWDCSDPNPQG